MKAEKIKAGVDYAVSSDVVLRPGEELSRWTAMSAEPLALVHGARQMVRTPYGVFVLPVGRAQGADGLMLMRSRPDGDERPRLSLVAVRRIRHRWSDYLSEQWTERAMATLPEWVRTDSGRLRRSVAGSLGDLGVVPESCDNERTVVPTAELARLLHLVGMLYPAPEVGTVGRPGESPTVRRASVERRLTGTTRSA